MREADYFTDFAIGCGPDGRPCATFSLAWSDWEAEAGEGGSPVHKSVFDEASLRLRIDNLQRQGLDASVSRAALAALLRFEGACPPGRAFLPNLPPLAPAFSALVAAMEEAVVIASLDAVGGGSTIVHVNPAFTLLTGYAPEDVLGRSLRQFHQGDAAEAAEATVIRSGQPAEGSALCQVRSGTACRVTQRLLPLRDPESGRITHLAAVLRPAPTMPAIPSEGERLGERDAVTGLAGPGALRHAIESDLLASARLRRPGRGPSLIALRVEGLAAIRERYGMATGDAVLLGVADRLIETLRRRDMPVRTSEADFAACLSGVGLREATEITTRLRQAVAAQPFDTPAGPMMVCISIGAAEAPPLGYPGGVEARMAALLAAVADALTRGVPEPATAGGD